MSEYLQNDRVVFTFCQQVDASVIDKNPFLVPFVQSFHFYFV